MSREILRFWLSALVAAVATAAAARWFLPYEALELRTASDRLDAWLVTLWCGGVMAVCFGAAGLLSVAAPLGVRDVAEAASVAEAIEARRKSRRALTGFHTNFAWWLIVTGLLLIGLYFLAWIVT